MTEDQLHQGITNYIKNQYPEVFFTSDMSGIPISSIPLRVKMASLRSEKGTPDILIMQTAGKKIVKNYTLEGDNLVLFEFAGLFLEVKKKTPYKKNGELKKDDHLKTQDKLHDKLRKQGYFVCFVWTFEMAKQIIDDYMTL